MNTTFTHKRFLCNEKHQSRLISMLINADTLMVRTAINMSSFNMVFIVREDIDLLVRIVALAKGHSNVYFQKTSKGKAIEPIYSLQSFQVEKTVADNILFLHAFSRCDTTTAIFDQGKKKFMKVLENSEKLNQTVQVFKEEGLDSDTFAAAGEKF
ncbi:hypothetical protein PR048_012862 [Dryococelus australis]|uniref:Uncharacterized protein n=1 Tax=Dryococelus australis TaxID=614101 RepID=A0ABQ9HQK3_9NEOP|nr:hypothetical protein PR048_012862 [Dryococelus australis]